MRVAFINTTADGVAAPSRLMLEIARGVVDTGGEAIVCWGRGDFRGDERLERYKVTSRLSVIRHYALSCINDAEGLGSLASTRMLVRRLREYGPDIIHLHNIHGHYLNYPFLLEELAGSGVPVVITMHDCWLMTGHCAFYSHFNCRKWIKSDCKGGCPLKGDYPRTIVSASARNFSIKRHLFEKMPNVTLVTPSRWMAGEVSRSHMRGLACRVIHNGIDTALFLPPQAAVSRDYILGVANRWEKRKNLDHIVAFARHASMPVRIVGGMVDRRDADGVVELLGHVDDIGHLAEIYRGASVLINPGSAETFGMTTVEALACGVPVVVNDATALREIADNAKVGVVTDTSDPMNIVKAVDRARTLSPEDCRRYVVDNYSVSLMIDGYLSLYDELCT